MSSEFDVDLAELRTLTSRLRAEAARITEAADSAREALEAQRAEDQWQRDEAQSEAAQAARQGEFGAARMELQKRLDRNQTTWHDVMSGADTHWSSKQVRDEFQHHFVSAIRDLTETDPEFAQNLDARLEQRTRERDG